MRIFSLSKNQAPIWLASSIFAQTSATVFFKLTGQSTTSFNIISIITNNWYLFALCALGIQAICWLQALRFYDLSVAHPISSLSIGTNLICATWLFDEKVTVGNLLGISLIILGVSLTSQASP